MVWLVAELTIEPFEEGKPGPHVHAALEAIGTDTVDTDFGPFSTTIRGEQRSVLDAVDRAITAAAANGATRVSVHVTASVGDG